MQKDPFDNVHLAGPDLVSLPQLPSIPLPTQKLEGSFQITSCLRVLLVLAG